MTSTLPTTTWSIDPTHSLVEFSAKHLMITTVKGRFASVSGTIEYDPASPAGATVSVSIDAASLDTRTAQRDDHLRSADFLDVQSFPTIGFVATRIEGGFKGPGDEFRLVGQLTIRGVTREVVLAVTFEGSGKDPWGGERVSFSATTAIDRRDFGLTWNQALETGGVVVSNTIKIALEVQATRNA